MPSVCAAMCGSPLPSPCQSAEEKMNMAQMPACPVRSAASPQQHCISAWVYKQGTQDHSVAMPDGLPTADCQKGCLKPSHACRFGSGAARGNAFAQAIGDISGQDRLAPAKLRSEGGGGGMRSDRLGGGIR